MAIVAKIILILLSFFWLFLALIVQMVFVGGNYAPDIYSYFQKISVFLLLSAPASLYISKIIHDLFLKTKISTILVFVLILLLIGLLRGGWIFDVNNRVGGRPVALASADNKTYVIDRGNIVYNGGNDPSRYEFVNPVIWVIDHQNFQLIEKIKIPDKDFSEHLNPNVYPQAKSFLDKVYYAYDQKLLIVNAANNSIKSVDLNKVASKPLLKSLEVRSFDIDENSKSLYLLFASSVYDSREKTTVLLSIDLEALTEKLQAEIKEESVTSEFSLPLKEVFVGSDGLVRLIIAPSIQLQPTVNVYALITIDSETGKILEESNTNIQADRAPVFTDKANNRIYIPSNSQYLPFDFITKAAGQPLAALTGSRYPNLALGSDYLYFFELDFGGNPKIIVIDRKSLRELNSFETTGKFTRFGSVVFATDNLVFLSESGYRKVLVYNREGKVISTIALKE